MTHDWKAPENRPRAVGGDCLCGESGGGGHVVLGAAQAWLLCQLHEWAARRRSWRTGERAGPAQERPRPRGGQGTARLVQADTGLVDRDVEACQGWLRVRHPRRGGDEHLSWDGVGTRGASVGEEADPRTLSIG